MLQDRFNQLAEVLGSPYAAVNYLANLARKLLIDNNNQILESQAITWALTGEAPKIERKKITKVDTSNMCGIDEVLCYVDDDEVCESVRNSYHQSLKSHHLIYCYHNSLDEYRKARVRILVRMIWYNIQSEGGIFNE